ncbi:MAG: hypothetical protein VYD19_07625 [Myxococcota bacterium]|nr:hypothetical protein [Myxococcota bacterium]
MVCKNRRGWRTLALLTLLISPSLSAAPIDPVIARVKGGALGSPEVEIRASALTEAMRQRPSEAPRALLESLIEEALLFQEAQRRGLDQRPSLRSARRLSLARRWIEEMIEAPYQPERLSREQLEEAYQRNFQRFNHPPLRSASQLLIRRADGKGSLGHGDHLIIGAFQARLEATLLAENPLDDSALQQIWQRLHGSAPEGYELRYEALGYFAEQGNYITPFTTHCFAATEAPQRLSPLETRFGIHYILLKEIRAARALSLDEVQEEIRVHLSPELKAYELRKRYQALWRAAEIKRPSAARAR